MLALASSPALAQVTRRSTILGTITDTQKAVVPAAEVQLKNLDTGGTWKAETGQAGEYVFSNLMAGRYQVEVIKQGFKKSLSTPTSLENGTTQRIDMSLEVGEVSQQVEVTAAAPLVHTDDANVDLVVENRLVQDMPIQGCNFLNYAVLAPCSTAARAKTGEPTVHWAAPRHPAARFTALEEPSTALAITLMESTAMTTGMRAPLPVSTWMPSRKSRLKSLTTLQSMDATWDR
jgi:hypothetical protein